MPRASRGAVLCSLVLATTTPAAVAYHLPPQQQHTPPKQICSRRTLCQAGTAAVLLLGSQTQAAQAALDERPAALENLSKAAAKLPGYGQPDCYFPESFLGTWEVTRTVMGVSTPRGDGSDVIEAPAALAEARSLQGTPVTYAARWVRRGDRVIADREFNTRNAEEAKRPGSVQQVLWDQANPNILTVNSSDGMIKEVKVTKRSFEAPAPGQYGTSEYARVVVASSEGMVSSVPQVTAVRTLTRYKDTSTDGGGGSSGGSDTMEGLELVKYYPAVSFTNDPDAYMTIKSRLSMVRRRTPAAAAGGA